MKRGLRLLQRWLRLARRAPLEAWLLLRLAAWAVWLSCVLQLLPLPAALRWLSPHTRAARPPRPVAPVRLAALVDQLLCLQFWVFRPVCWKRALLLHRFLRLSGWETRVVFGVRRDEAGLAGHAWLEVAGEPFLEQRAPDYHRTFSYP